MGRILLIEDDGELAETIKNELSEEGYVIEEAYSYITAIAALEEHDGDFDCIILDLEIPSDGLEDENLMDEYHGIYGILVLDQFCKAQTQKRPEDIWNKTIIYSEYTENLNGKDIMKNPPEKLPPINKKENNSVSRLLKRVKEIVNKKSRL